MKRNVDQTEPAARASRGSLPIGDAGQSAAFLMPNVLLTARNQLCDSCMSCSSQIHGELQDHDLQQGGVVDKLNQLASQGDRHKTPSHVRVVHALSFAGVWMWKSAWECSPWQAI